MLDISHILIRLIS